VHARELILVFASTYQSRKKTRHTA